MALKIRLRQQGRRNHAVYRLVLSEARFPRDGKYIEQLGWYDPHNKENTTHINDERVMHWLEKGAILTEKAAHLVKQAAPEVMEKHQRRQIQLREKTCVKRKKLRKKNEVVAA